MAVVIGASAFHKATQDYKIEFYKWPVCFYMANLENEESPFVLHVSSFFVTRGIASLFTVVGRHYDLIF